MLLWLEEAAIEAAMILAVTVGSLMLIAAVWSLTRDSMTRRRLSHPGPKAKRSTSVNGIIVARPSTHSDATEHRGRAS